MMRLPLTKPRRRPRGAQPGHPGWGGRPRGVTMPCGWGCGKRLTASEIRAHFTSCPKNAWRRDNVLMRARAQAAPPRQPAAVRRTHGPGDLYSRALRVEPAAELWCATIPASRVLHYMGISRQLSLERLGPLP